MVLIHEKISALLEQRRLKKRDLARALGVSPQTATDICKGRSAITLPHLRNLVAFFELRADFWLDEYRLVPADLDRNANRVAADALARTGLLQISDPERFMHRIRGLVLKHRSEFLAAHPDLSIDERGVLGLIGSEKGTMGQIADS
ncbi:MAG TPA: helix-turn-helix domain-containing protein [Planctomycetota bacterium]